MAAEMSWYGGGHHQDLLREAGEAVTVLREAYEWLQSRRWCRCQVCTECRLLARMQEWVGGDEC